MLTLRRMQPSKKLGRSPGELERTSRLLLESEGSCAVGCYGPFHRPGPSADGSVFWPWHDRGRESGKTSHGATYEDGGSVKFNWPAKKPLVAF